MVTKPNTPMPSGPTGLMKNPTKIEPPKQVSGFGSKPGSGDDIANKDRTGENKFSLPEKLTQQEVRDNSFKYGGGRSAGNRPALADKIEGELEP